MSKLSLDREHGGEDEYATHQTDNVVHDRRSTAQLHCSLVPLHECGICQKGSKSSTYQGVKSEIYPLLIIYFYYHAVICIWQASPHFSDFSWQLPVSQAFWEIASSHSLEDLMLAADIDRDFNSTAHNNSCISMSLTSAAMGLETCKQHTKTYQNLARTCV